MYDFHYKNVYLNISCLVLSEQGDLQKCARHSTCKNCVLAVSSSGFLQNCSQKVESESFEEERTITYPRALEMHCLFSFFFFFCKMHCPYTFQNQLFIPLRMYSPNTEIVFHQRVKKQLKMLPLPFLTVCSSFKDSSVDITL